MDMNLMWQIEGMNRIELLKDRNNGDGDIDDSLVM